MRCLIALLVLFLLAGSANDTRAPAPDSSRDVYVDRHIDAHVPAREGEPAPSVPDDRSERSPGPDPAAGVFPPASPPIQNPRDPLHRQY
jgi:hypothetical protein